jgi:hypothetical protein
MPVLKALGIGLNQVQLDLRIGADFVGSRVNVNEMPSLIRL